MYKFLLEKNYGIILKDLNAVTLHPDNKNKSF